MGSPLFSVMFQKIHLVADWPVMLNDVVIAVVVTVVVTEVVVARFVVMVGLSVVVAVVDDVLGVVSIGKFEPDIQLVIWLESEK